jgi:DNA polymerase
LETVLFIDFETRSAVDIRQCGADVYAAHPTTDLLCMGYAISDGAVRVVPYNTKPKQVFFNEIRSGITVIAHNAPFELAIWNKCCVPKYGWPPLDPKQVRCTMAMAYAMSLPGSLDACAAALGIKEQKDKLGHRIMLQVSQPRSVEDDGKIVWWTPADRKRGSEKFKKLYAYCTQDLEVLRESWKRLKPLSSTEQAMWELDYKINQRGIQVDRKSVQVALDLVVVEKAKMDEQMRVATKGVVGTCNAVGQLTDWLRYKGIKTKTVTKSDVSRLLRRKDTPEDVKEVLLLRQAAAKTSTAKLKPMGKIDNDGRIRGTMQYHGAGTGRWAGRRLQVHNFPRPKIKQAEIEEIFGLFVKNNPQLSTLSDEINMFYGSPIKIVSDCLRGFLIAKPGHLLVGCDFSAIEARVVAWLAGEERILKVFRGDGKVYEYAAANQIFHIPIEQVTELQRLVGKVAVLPIEQVTELQRLVGKVAVLALGFGGGKGAFVAMGRNLGLNVSEEQAEQIKLAWRAANPNIVRFWYALEETAMMAVRKPKQTFSCGQKNRKISYQKNGSFLWCQLPSKRVICYPYPKIELVDTPWGEKKLGLTYMGTNSYTRKWEKQKAYGGMLCENVTQAVARDLLAESIIRLENAGYPVIMHVHDEALCEVEQTEPADTIEGCSDVGIVEKIMSQVPDWATGLPITAKGWIGFRYRK